MAQADTYANERVRFTNTAGYSPGYARAQESLARWCGENGLAEEARVHWAHLLLQEPKNREAARALGLIEVGGRFFTRQQAAHAGQLARDTADSIAKWQDKLTRLQREAASPDEARRKTALGELQTVDDPNAVFALELVALGKRAPKASGQSMSKHLIAKSSRSSRSSTASRRPNRWSALPFYTTGQRAPLRR